MMDERDLAAKAYAAALKYSYAQPRDANGRWVAGAGGVASSPAQAALAAHLTTEVVGRARAAEPAITSDITGLATASGGEAVGLAYRLKGEGSTRRKIIDDAKADNVSLETAAASVSDGVRYTINFPAGKYASGTSAAIDGLAKAGYTNPKIKNYWEKGDAYQGINANFTSPTGTRFELQFHTAPSFALKNGRLHTLYEGYRVSTNNAQRRKIWDEMVSTSDALEVPSGALELGHLKRQSHREL